MRYTEVYPGIDVVYYGNQQQLEYDFVVAPGRDPRDDQASSSRAQTRSKWTRRRPAAHTGRERDSAAEAFVYQEVAASGARSRASTRSTKTDKSASHRRVRRAAAARHRSGLIYSTYLGGSGNDQARDIAVDSSGNAYICGETASTNFPTANAFDSSFNTGNIAADRDAFVTKLNAAGTALVYSTYLGGTGNTINSQRQRCVYRDRG